MNLRPDPRHFTDPKTYLQAFYEFKKKEKPSFSLRSWAKRMGFNNHSLLSCLLNGKLPIRPRHCGKIISTLHLTRAEQEYFETLVQLHSSNSGGARRIYEERLKELSENPKMMFLEQEKFKAVSNWIHFAILEMTGLKGFKLDPKWIEERLGARVSVREIKNAIQTLKNLDLIQLESGNWKKTHQKLHFESEQGSAAVREYHHQVIDLAKEAIDSQSKEERMLHSFSFPMNPERIEEARSLIMEFRSKLVSLLEETPGSEVYQCNLQLFRVTKK